MTPTPDYATWLSSLKEGDRVFIRLGHNETIRTPVSVEVVQRIEGALGIDLGVNFEG